MDLLTWIPHTMGNLNHMIEQSATAWWVVPLVALFCLIDGFFLFLPSETAIVALATVSSHIGHPNIWLLWAGGALGAILGDNVAYYLGRALGTTRFRWMRRPKVAAAFGWAHKELEKRGAVLIFTARYIPVGRIAVNFTAGATRFSHRQFFILDAFAAVTWAGYSVGIGVLAGGMKFLHHNQLLSIGIAVVAAVIMGFLVDHAMKLLHKWLDKRHPRPDAKAPDARLESETEPAAPSSTFKSESAAPSSVPFQDTSTITHTDKIMGPETTLRDAELAKPRIAP